MKKSAFRSLMLGLLLLLVFNVSCNEKEEVVHPGPPVSYSVEIPSEGNSWMFRNPGTPQEQVMNPGSQTWTDPALVHRTYFRIEGTGELHVGINARVENGTSVVKAVFMDEDVELTVNQTSFSQVFVGSFQIDAPGYYYIDLQGVSKESLEFLQISDVLLGGGAARAGVHYVNEEYFYWGRRGPSVHLTYEVPQQATDVHYFYNEVTVPEGNDVIGSFFMANGFGQGYFGFQVNSETERRILFSVWSPFHTDNPSEIPEDQRVQLIRRGDNIVVNDFGNEGSGGQSFLRYNWEAGKTYRFLLKAEPAAGQDNATDYTAWFKSPDTGEWVLLVTWRRPLISTYITGAHSFLENFTTRTGPLARKAYYDNQWILDASGNWYELTRARFTADATARDKARLDYAGGLAPDNMGFYMKNCGFFDETTAIDSWFTRPAKGQQPDIDLESLP